MARKRILFQDTDLVVSKGADGLVAATIKGLETQITRINVYGKREDSVDIYWGSDTFCLILRPTKVVRLRRYIQRKKGCIPWEDFVSLDELPINMPVKAKFGDPDRAVFSRVSDVIRYWDGDIHRRFIICRIKAKSSVFILFWVNRFKGSYGINRMRLV